MIQTFKISLKAIWSNRLRSFLTMLGIIIGVMSMVMLVSIGRAATSSVTGTIESMGSGLITATITDSDLAVSIEDVESLADYGYIDAVAPVASGSFTLKYVGENATVTTSSTVTGVTADYLAVYGLELQSGRNVVASDLEWRTQVALIGTDVAGDLFESYDVIGKTIAIDDRVFTVVGLLAESGTSTFGSNNDTVLIPLTTAMRMTGDTAVTSFYASADSADVTYAQTLTEMFLLEQTRDEDAYTVYNQSEALDALSEVTDTLSLMLGGIAAIALLVGGIGIMNIMLVSVTERTREIGIRKAIGARRANIMGQFLVEACVLSVLGGLIGLAMSFAGLRVFALIAGYSVALDMETGLLAIAFCAAIGVIFGSYPAAKASRLMPIVALRAQ